MPPDSRISHGTLHARDLAQKLKAMIERAKLDKLTPAYMKRLQIGLTETIDNEGRERHSIELTLATQQKYHLLILSPFDMRAVLGLPPPPPPEEEVLNPFTEAIAQLAETTQITPEDFAHARTEIVTLQGDNGYPFRAVRITLPDGTIYAFALLTTRDFREPSWEPNPAHRQLFPPAFAPPAMRVSTEYADGQGRHPILQREPVVDSAPPRLRFQRERSEVGHDKKR